MEISLSNARDIFLVSSQDLKRVQVIVLHCHDRLISFIWHFGKIILSDEILLRPPGFVDRQNCIALWSDRSESCFFLLSFAIASRCKILFLTTTTCSLTPFRLLDVWLFEVRSPNILKLEADAFTSMHYHY